jgi:hypothetical protein
MRKMSFIAVSAFFLFLSCSKLEKNQSQELTKEDAVETVNQRQCASYDVLEQQMKLNPGLRAKMDEIENFTKDVLKNPSRFKLVNGVLEVPVHVNVVYRTAAENISNGQIQSQIDVLNEDFAALNADYNNTPTLFQTVRAGDTKIKFIWDATKVTRRASNKRSWGTNDDMKRSSRGGINPTDPTTTLNIWSCNLSNGILGYAQFPGGSSTTDGVVILYSAFGSRAKFPGGTYTTTFDRGRTGTHEVGHYFNLRHIWGDATCGNDQVGDTPAHNTANYGCPTYPHLSTCTGNPVEMTMNYMDYTNDVCMYMFTAGQAARMQATFAVGGPRASLR